MSCVNLIFATNLSDFDSYNVFAFFMIHVINKLITKIFVPNGEKNLSNNIRLSLYIQLSSQQYSSHCCNEKLLIMNSILHMNTNPNSFSSKMLSYSASWKINNLKLYNFEKSK